MLIAMSLLQKWVTPIERRAPSPKKNEREKQSYEMGYRQKSCVLYRNI